MTVISQALTGDLEAAVSKFENAVIEWTEDELLVPLTQEDLADAYLATEALIARLKYAGAAIGQPLGLTIKGKDPVLVRPVATIEKKVGKPRKAWNHQVLKSVVAEAILRKRLDPETGTITCPPSALIADAFNAVSISAWKSTVCKPLGVNLDYYCEVSPPNTNLIVRWAGPRPGETNNHDEDEA